MVLDRYIPVLQEIKPNEKSVSKRDLQEELRKIWEAVHVLEGRSGPVNILDSVTIHGDLETTGSITATTANLSDTFIQTERPFDSQLSYVPDPAPTGSGAIYVDRVLDRFRVSENFRNYQDLVMYEQARVYSSVNNTIADSTETPLTFDSVRWDTDSCFSLGSPTKLTINHAGNYSVGCNVRWTGDATGIRRARITLNGATDIASSSDDPDSVAVTNLNLGCDWQFSVGDYVEVNVRQTSGGPLDVLSTAADSCEFWITRLQ